MRKNKIKMLMLSLCAVLLGVVCAYGTMAYLYDKDVATNTFTVGKVAITLDETDVDGSTPNQERDQENKYHLLPGWNYKKDPTVHVETGSEDCYVYVKVLNGMVAYEAMPGDCLSDDIQIENDADDCDYIKLYLKAVPHDEQGNPFTYSEQFENIDGKDQTQIEGQRDETFVTMQDFLSVLTMRIYNGEDLIYEASPDQKASLTDYVLLGTLRNGEMLSLHIELDVPITLGNEYADRVGEVDWVFLAECIEWEKLTVHKVWDDNGYPDRPDSVSVNLLCNGEKSETIQLSEENQWTYTWKELDDRYQWTIQEVVPDGYEVSYKTEDNTVFIENHKDYEPPYEPQTENLQVKKAWDDDNNKQNKRPTSVSVTLYNGSQAVEKVTLSEENNWSYRWENLDANGNWSVLETGIPSGYIPSYHVNGEQVMIINTGTFIQTGQLNWPIWILSGAGICMIGIGVLVTCRKKQKHE